MRHQSNLVLNEGLAKISKQRQNKKQNTQTNKEKANQNKNNYSHCDFPVYSKCGKSIL
jgi:hypothetical protein